MSLSDHEALFLCQFFQLLYMENEENALDAGEGPTKEAAELQEAVLEAIPAMAQHSACIPFCIRILKPLSAEGRPALSL